jgi:hypothetical protein
MIPLKLPWFGNEPNAPVPISPVASTLLDISENISFLE